MDDLSFPPLTLGKANEEGGCCGQVWNSLRFVFEKDGKEDRNITAREVCMLLLWKGACCV